MPRSRGSPPHSTYASCPLPRAAGNFTNLRNILLSPLPRAYEEAQSGVAVACSEGDAKLIGQGIQADALLHVAQDLKNRLEEEVVKPLKHWYHAYKNIAVSAGARRALHAVLQ